MTYFWLQSEYDFIYLDGWINLINLKTWCLLSAKQTLCNQSDIHQQTAFATKFRGFFSHHPPDRMRQSTHMHLTTSKYLGFRINLQLSLISCLVLSHLIHTIIFGGIEISYASIVKNHLYMYEQRPTVKQLVTCCYVVY